MSNGITGTARDGRLPAIRLHPVKDGVLGFGEVRVTATQRDKLSTEQAKVARAVDPARPLDGKLPEVLGERWVQKKGKIVRNLRTLTDGDGTLPTRGKVEPAPTPHDDHSPTGRKGRKGGTLAQADKAMKQARTSQPRDYTQHDAIIRATGYTGPITSDLRKKAGDVIAFRKSLL